MTTKVSAAEAKAGLSSLVSKVEYGNERFVIERRGRPVAALVSIEDLERLEQGGQGAASQRGALAMVGMWGDIATDEELDEMVNHIYTTREQDKGRPVDLDLED